MKHFKPHQYYKKEVMNDLTFNLFLDYTVPVYMNKCEKIDIPFHIPKESINRKLKRVHARR